jgi:hypothetical protein
MLLEVEVSDTRSLAAFALSRVPGVSVCNKEREKAIQGFVLISTFKVTRRQPGAMLIHSLETSVDMDCLG